MPHEAKHSRSFAVVAAVVLAGGCAGQAKQPMVGGVATGRAADKQVAQVGDPINLKLEIKGQGNVKTMATPEILTPDGFKMYESGSASSVSRHGYAVSGSKTYEFVLVPQRGHESKKNQAHNRRRHRQGRA